MSKKTMLNEIQPRIKAAMQAGNTKEAAILIDAREMALSSKRTLAECEKLMRSYYSTEIVTERI